MFFLVTEEIGHFTTWTSKAVRNRVRNPQDCSHERAGPQREELWIVCVTGLLHFSTQRKIVFLAVDGWDPHRANRRKAVLAGSEMDSGNS